MNKLSQLDPIVSTTWLVEHRDQVIVVDARAYLDDRDGKTNYLAGHLPGAVFVGLDDVVCGPPGTGRGRHPMPDPDVFAAGLGAVGIDGQTPVVAYDDLGGMITGRLVWMLRSLGHAAALLDGGIQAWDQPLETGTGTAVEEASFPTPVFAISGMVDADVVSAHIKTGGVVADSRAPERYAGEVEPMDPKAGHIPGAINLAFGDNLDAKGKFLSAEDLLERFAASGVDADSIFYCGSGVSACHNLLAVERAGLGVPRLYVGSWSGWSSTPGRPVATGFEA